MTAKIWTNNYAPVLPFTAQDFPVGALLPMILYLFRWGHRRGRGRFSTVFASEGGGKPTVRSVSHLLALDPRFDGFDSKPGLEVIGDMLLSSVLENRRRSESHDEQVQRCFPAHYMASWIDLPLHAANLRGVPEAIVAIIADQPTGETLEAGRKQGRYPVGARIQDNELVRSFSQGVEVEGDPRASLRSAHFDESAEIGLDQLLTVRLAQFCGEAPIKARGKGEASPIPNQRPIASKATKEFREDLLTFFDCYGRNQTVPRLSLLPMFESAIAVGLTTILLSTIRIVEHWVTEGSILEPLQQIPWPVFMDCSGSADPQLRDFSEQSGVLVRQQLSRLSGTLMYMRLLDFYVRTESDIPRKDLPESAPDATAWLNLLGKVAKGTHEESRDAERYFRSRCRSLVDASGAAGSAELRTDILGNEADGQRHGTRLAEALTLALEEGAGGDKVLGFLSAALMTDEPNGLARRRRITVKRPGVGGRKTADVASFVLTNTVLEYLVHRHLRRSGKGRKSQSLSLPSFLKILRERYGFHIDQSPPNMIVPNELLQRNRRVVERRLRDLGLLVGVNDAERMKKLRARYTAAYDTDTSEVIVSD